MAKADLVKDAEGKGILLTGKETVDELKALLEAHGEGKADVEGEAALPEEDPAVIEAQQKVAEAQQAVVDAQTALGEAKAEHEAAVADHAKLTAPPLPVVGKQYLMEGAPEPQNLTASDLAEFGIYPRRIMVNGISYEHVSEATGLDEAGELAVAWVYRRM